MYVNCPNCGVILKKKYITSVYGVVRKDFCRCGYYSKYYIPNKKKVCL